MFKLKRQGFSLAEAMITLLIVCLITLASIPVITKKKRPQANLASGIWMCTKNSSGQYVVWESKSPQGDMKNPDEWKLTDTNSCTFHSPMNTKNFVVTIIGGGGGGQDGKSERSKNYLDPGITNYTPMKDGIYHLAVIGGGGGGAGSDDDLTGGAGGSGAYWIGQVLLRANTTYVSTNGKGAKGKADGGSKARWGDYAGSSTFGIPGTTYITAGGGKGGRATGDDFFTGKYGGQGGHGGELKLLSSFNSTFEAKKLKANNGTEGKKRSTQTTPGVDIPGNFWGVIDNTTNKLLDKKNVGYGGHGYNGYVGQQGDDGATYLWQIIQNAGTGGLSGETEHYTVPHIKKKAIVTIGDGGDANNPGNPTIVDIYNMQGDKIIKTLKAKGGKAGEPIEEINYSNTNKITSTDGTDGENSAWNNSPGGKTGQCNGGKITNNSTSEKYYIYKLDANGEKICKLKYCDIGKFDQVTPIQPGQPATNFVANCSLFPTGYNTGVCIGLDRAQPISNDYTKLKFKLETIDDKSRTFNYQELVKEIEKINKNLMIEQWENSERQCNTETITCLVYETEETTADLGTGNLTEANKSDATNGSAFGAGGGGGCTTNQIGVFGKGGEGAPGAVIIEW